MPMEKTYQPQTLEKKWYQHWEQSGYFAPQNGVESYCIMLPPPNVTGTLHMGHAFQGAIMDALIRLHRMQGYQTLWQGGTDHAGIATQMVVERQLESQGVAKKDLSREAFIDKIWQWKTHSGNTISSQMRRLGSSIDWTRERFTLDEGLSKAVNTVFVRLYEDDLIYRGKRLVNWDPKFHTAVSDLEVISEEEEGNLWYIRYPLINSDKFLVVATTRPETMLGDVAVAVNPEDVRYSALIGQKIALPLTHREIPIIADEYVEPEFGTGCVKITPAHDFNDYQIGKRHNLDMINIFTVDANINEEAPKAYQGLNRFVAREKIVQDLDKLGLLEKIEPYKIKVPRADKSGEIVEPYLTDQWFVRTAPLAKAAIEVVETGKINFYPENWRNDYFEWMRKIEDWCISRQIWWGHRIPAWYDDNGNVYVAQSESAVREKYQLSPETVLRQEEDVLDTWFSSALWPFSTLGWPEKTPELQAYYPTNVLVTGFDIIFFWVARMIMMGLKFMDDVPFKEVFVHGLIQDAKGQKMSKSKGNILDPIDLIDGISLEDLVTKRTSGLMQPQMAKQIEKDTRQQYPQGIQAYGTDALRFTLCTLASNNRHIRFDLARVEGYRNFCNKIWNAARFGMMNVENKPLGNHAGEREYSLYDKWIWSRLQKTKAKVLEHIKIYRFDIAAHALYEFIWNEYCDWYLEFSKPVLTKENFSEKEKAGTRYTLIAVLEEIMRALHPMMPFITEEIWQKLVPILGKGYFKKAPETIMTQAYPEMDTAQVNDTIEEEVSFVQKVIVAIRTLRSEKNLSPSQLLPVIVAAEDEKLLQIVLHHQDGIKFLARLEKVEKANANDSTHYPLSTIVENVKISIPTEDLFDKEAETKRLTKNIDKLNKDIALYKKKLENPNYVEKAPPEIVQQERDRLQHALTEVDKYIVLLKEIS